VENFCSDRVAPHCGQGGASRLLPKTSFSKIDPQTGHTYSKMGMAYEGSSLDLMPQLECSSFPDGEERRGDQV